MQQNLLNKLKLLPEEKNLVLNAPEVYLKELKELSFDTVPQQEDYDFVQLFVQSGEEADKWIPTALKAIWEDGKLWCCYPKKTSGIKTDINRDKGWDVLLEKGYGAVASVSIDETWSAIRFRPENKIDRKGARIKSPAPKSSPDRMLEVPEYIQIALNAHPQEKEFFESLAFSHRKEYVQWVVDAKREDTRQRRLLQMLELLKEKKKGRYS